jgi:UDP-2,3-diacylglucosamine pyrophosphatase LpxH
MSQASGNSANTTDISRGTNPPAKYLNARTVWISDVHLGYRDCKADYLLDFLDQIKCDTLYLVGDIVDTWALKRRFKWPPKHYQVLLKLCELADRGVRVIYVPGNHDDPMRRFSGKFFGAIEVALEYEYISADGKRWLVMHGDAMDNYINLSWITRLCGSMAYGLLLFVNRWSNRLRRWTGRPYFSLAGLIKSNIRGARVAVETYENEAMEEARRRGFDGVICGHIHCPALLEHNGISYANTGDWVENCTALLEDWQGQMQLLHYSDQLQWHSPVAVAGAAQTV